MMYVALLYQGRAWAKLTLQHQCQATATTGQNRRIIDTLRLPVNWACMTVPRRFEARPVGRNVDGKHSYTNTMNTASWRWVFVAIRNLKRFYSA